MASEDQHLGSLLLCRGNLAVSSSDLDVQPIPEIVSRKCPHFLGDIDISKLWQDKHASLMLAASDLPIA